MITISLCMIVKNEEENIQKVLSSVKGIADEIIIVDTGSSDNTKKIAKSFTGKIYDFAWIDDFSAARNFAYSKATMEYVLWLDADDILLPKDRAAFLQLKETLPADVDVVMMGYNTGFDDFGNVVFSYYRERLTKRSKCFLWREPVHEYLEIGGKIINSDVCITHTKKNAEPSTRNIKIYEKILKKNKKLSIRGTYYYARELKDNGRYFDAIKMFNKFLDSEQGWVEDNITACHELARCYLLEGDREKALLSMFRSFKYHSPRAELCCQIGYYFKEQKEYKQAIFWFELALKLEKPQNTWGFIQHDFWGYIPCLECAICYDKLGLYKQAELFNHQAGVFKPNSQAVLYNKKYFEKRKEEEHKQAGE